MAINVETFRARFPEFSDEAEYSNSRINLFITDSVIYMGDQESRWQGKYDLAQSYLSAHLLISGEKTELGDISASSGAIQSKSAGGVSVSKAVVAKDRSDLDEFYMSTAYGQQFLNVRGLCFAGAIAANKI
jgi:hypothetical protein